MRRVLVLDSSYQPLEVVSWTRAMMLMLSGKAEMVEEYDDVEVRSADQSWKLPSVLRKVRSLKRKRGVVFSRHNIFFRDDWICQYCGGKHQARDLTFDHVVPRSRGGSTTWQNVVSACFPCNQKKGARTPRESRMKLLRDPIKPKWMPTFTVRMKESDPESWRNYLYWNTELVPG